MTTGAATAPSPATTLATAHPRSLLRQPLFIYKDAGTAEYIEKYNKYQAEYVRWLKAKYFSKKTFNGGNIFDQEMDIDGETIKSSRWPCTRSFAEPVQSLQESSTLPSSASETSTLLGRKQHLKKSS